LDAEFANANAASILTLQKAFKLGSKHS